MLRPLLVHVVVSEKRAPSRGFQDTVYWLWSFNLAENDKVVRILKKRAREMSRSGKVSRTFEFLHVFGAAEKIQAKV